MVLNLTNKQRDILLQFVDAASILLHDRETNPMYELKVFNADDYEQETESIFIDEVGKCSINALFETLKRPEGLHDVLDRDLYAIEADSEGNKTIHILGYFYFRGCEDEPFALCEWSGLEIPIDEFVTAYKSNEDYVVDLEDECKQYQDDMTEDEAEEAYVNYFPSKPKHLPFADITPDTPCGYYHN